MSVASRPRSAPFSEDHNWPRHKPVFSLLTLADSQFSAEWEFSPISSKPLWTPLQQYYLRDYFRTAQVSSSRNRFLRPPSAHRVLAIMYPNGTRMALDNEVAALPVQLGATVSSTSLCPRRPSGSPRGAWSGRR